MSLLINSIPQENYAYVFSNGDVLEICGVVAKAAAAEKNKMKLCYPDANSNEFQNSLSHYAKFPHDFAKNFLQNRAIIFVHVFLRFVFSFEILFCVFIINKYLKAFGTVRRKKLKRLNEHNFNGFATS